MPHARGVGLVTRCACPRDADGALATPPGPYGSRAHLEGCPDAGRQRGERTTRGGGKGRPRMGVPRELVPVLEQARRLGPRAEARVVEAARAALASFETVK